MGHLSQTVTPSAWWVLLITLAARPLELGFRFQGVWWWGSGLERLKCLVHVNNKHLQALLHSPLNAELYSKTNPKMKQISIFLLWQPCTVPEFYQTITKPHLLCRWSITKVKCDHFYTRWCPDNKTETVVKRTYQLFPTSQTSSQATLQLSDNDKFLKVMFFFVCFFAYTRLSRSNELSQKA